MDLVSGREMVQGDTEKNAPQGAVALPNLRLTERAEQEMGARSEVYGADPVGEPGPECVVSGRGRRVSPLGLGSGNSQQSFREAG